jgi:hypothetical protein
MASKQRPKGPTRIERATKAERREQARRRRAEIERKMARSRRSRFYAVEAAVLVVVLVSAYVFTRPKPKPPASAERLLASAASAAQSAGCTSVQDVGPYQPESMDRVHIGTTGGPATMPALSTYPSVPPASGPHNPTPLDAGVYPSAPPIDQAIHSLEHGAAIVWYDPGATGEQLAKIKTFYGDPQYGSRVIVAPYDYPDQGAAGHLRAGVQMALVSWHHLETCSLPSLAAAFGFTAHYTAPPYASEKYLGDAPEAGAAI